MIQADLYPTYGTSTQGANSELTMEYTESVGATYQSVTINDLSAYYLGWIRPEKLPSTYKRGAIYLDSENNKVVIKTFQMFENAPCTYVYPYNLSPSSGTKMCTTFIQTVDGVTTINGNPPIRLYNQLYPEYAGVSHNNNTSYHAPLDISFITALYDGGDNLINVDSYQSLRGSAGLKFGTGDNDRTTIRQAYNFLYKGTQGQIHFRYNNVDYYFNCVADDFANGTAYLEDTTGNYHARFFLTGYYMLSNTRISGQSAYPNNITFCAKVKGVDHNGKIFIDETTAIGRYIYTGQTWYAGSGQGVRYSTPENPLYLSGLFADDEIDLDDVLRVVNYNSQSQGHPYGWTDTVVYYHLNYNGTTFYPLVYIDEIKRHFALNLRVDISGANTPSYADGLTYATDVTAGNEFLAKLKTGDITNTTFKNGLREWQYEDFQSNDFDEDDVPPYGPEPEPGDDNPDDEPEDIDDAYGDGDEDQDDIVITAPSQFITQYILTASQLRTVGSNLWSSWVDPNTDVYKNFLFDFFQDTGTFNITAALDYIISLRVYPFALTGMTTEYLGVSNGVYMGTGHTNFCPGTIPTLNTVIGYLDAGTLDVNLHVPYKDFRDLYNCSVMAFLPFCGTVELNPVEVIGKKLHAKYFIDFQSGACTAVIRVNNDGVEYTIASKSGQIGFMLPVSATNSGQLAAQYVGDATRAIGTLSGLFFDVASSVGRSAENAVKIMSAGEGGEESAPTGMTVTESLNIGKSGVKTALGFANQATDMLSRSGIDMPMLSGGAGAESLFLPPYVCLQVRRGKYAKPNNYPHSVGYYNLSSNPISYYRGAYQGSPSTGSNTGKGFCTFTGVDTSGLDCREDERAEILELLNTGIYL